MRIISLLRHNAVFHYLKSLGELFTFYTLNCILKRRQDTYFYLLLFLLLLFFLLHRTLGAIVFLSPISYSWWIICFLQLYLSIKDFIFDILYGFFFKFLYSLMELLQRVENIIIFIYIDLNASFFIQRENLYMIHHDLNLFYVTDNLINDKITTCHFLF